jgi:hypothetical protein
MSLILLCTSYVIKIKRSVAAIVYVDLNSHSGVNEEFYLRGERALKSIESQAKFRGNISLPSSGFMSAIQSYVCDLIHYGFLLEDQAFDPEDGGEMFF